MQVKQSQPFIRLPLALGIAAATSALWTGTTHAQGSGGEHRYLEEIVITARKTEESQQDVPVSVIAMSDQVLKANAVVNVYDIQAITPGLFIAPNSQGTNPTFAIRAAKADNGTSDTVSAYIDDVPVPWTTAIQNMMYDMGSIQVLKGPQGTFFGTSTTGGAVIFSPNKPSEDFEGYIGAGAGNWGLTTFEGMINAPLSDVLQLRLAGESIKRDGFIDNATPVNGNDELSDDDHYSARLSVRFRPNDTVLNDLEIDYFEADNQPYQESLVALRDRHLYPTFLGFPVPVDWELAGITVPKDPFDVALGPNPTWYEADSTSVGNTTTIEINDNWSIKNAFGYWDVMQDTAQDNDATILAGVNGRTRYDIEQWSEELSVDFTSDSGRFRNKTGVFFQNRQIDAINTYRVIGLAWDLTGYPPEAAGAVAGFLPLASNSVYFREFDTRAIYTQFTYEITETLTMTLGGRYTWDEGDYHATNRLQFPIAGGLGEFGDPDIGDCVAGLAGYKNFDPELCRGYQDFEDSNPSAVFTLEKKFSDQTLGYVSTRHGYLIGGFNNQVYEEPAIGPYQTFEPETVTDIEVGVKSDWSLAERPIRTNLAVFYGEYEDQQRVQNGITDTGTTFIAVANAGKSHFYGWDLDVTYEPADYLQLVLGWNHVIAEYDEFLAPVNISGANPPAYISREDKQLSQTPKDVFSLSATVTWPVSSEVGDISSTLTYYWRDKADHHDSPTYDCELAADGECITVLEDFSKWDELPSYDLVNFTTQWSNVMGSSFDLRLWVRNLLDEEYQVYGSNQLVQYHYATLVQGNPREWGVNLRYNF